MSTSGGAAGYTLPTPAAPGGLYTGTWFVPISASVTSTSATLGNGLLRLVPVILPTLTITAVGAECTVVGDAASTMLPAIYADNGQGSPGALFTSFPAAISGNSATAQQTALGANLLLPAGLYWLGGVVQNVTTVQPTIRTTSTAAPPAGIFLPSGATVATTSSGISGVSYAGVTGALPANLGATVGASAGSAPRIAFRLA